MALFPSSVSFLPEEEIAIARIRVAHYLGQVPSAVDAMPYSDVAAVLEVMRADQTIETKDY